MEAFLVRKSSPNRSKNDAKNESKFEGDIGGDFGLQKKRNRVNPAECAELAGGMYGGTLTELVLAQDLTGDSTRPSAPAKDGGGRI